MVLRVALLFFVLGACGARAFTLEEFAFDSPTKEAEFRTLIGKLRCLVCQNESLAASQASLAQDLRREVYDMMRAGRSEADILAFLTARYGDFVLYEPPLKPATYLLWFGPFVVIGVATFFAVRALTRQKNVPEAALDEAERERLRRWLAARDTHPEERS